MTSGSASTGSIEQSYPPHGVPYGPSSTFPGVFASGNASVHLGNVYQTIVKQDAGEGFLSTGGRDQLYRALLNSLVFTRMDSRQNAIHDAMPSTCMWLHEHQNFVDWDNDELLSDHHGFLWIKGKPGTGKSTVMKETLRRVTVDRPNDVVLSYFFNARAPGDLEKSPLGLYRSFVHQLLNAVPQIRDKFASRFSSKVDAKTGNISEWESSELQTFLVEISRSRSTLRLVCFVDALDEGDQQEVRQMIGFLEDLASHAITANSGNNIRVCLASRHYPHISIKKGRSIVLEAEVSHSADIQAYVDKKLAMEEEEVYEKVRSTIMLKSSQIFLWVVLVIPIVNKLYDDGLSADDLLSELNKLPNELHNLFESIIFREGCDMKETALLFQWVLFTRIPLDIHSLYSAIASPDMHMTQAPSLNQIKRRLLNTSRGLVEFMRSDSSWGTVQFIHETIRDFLLQLGGLKSLDPALQENAVGQSHENLKECCISRVHDFAICRQRWLQGGVSVEQQRTRLQEHNHCFAILPYAMRYMFNHAEVAQGYGIKQDSFLDLVDPESDFFLELAEQSLLTGSSHFREPSVLHQARSSSLLYLLICQGRSRTDNLVAYLIEKGADLNSRGGRLGYPLHVACTEGDAELVEYLINAGADVKAQAGRFGTPLIALVMQSNITLSQAMSVAKILLAKGAPLDQKGVQSINGRALARKLSPLRSALQGYNSKVLEMLVEAGADPNEVSGDGLTILGAVVAERIPNARLVNLLVKHGADLNRLSPGARDIATSLLGRG